MRSSIALLLLLAGCASFPSAEWHVQRAKRHMLLAESKGAKIDKEVRYDTITVEVPVPGDSSSKSIKPVIAEDDFFADMSRNDSLVAAINSLQQAIATGVTLDKEKTMSALKKANEEIWLLRKRIAQGYSKDSTYVVDDGYCTLEARIKNGLLDNLRHTRQDTIFKVDKTIPVEIRNILKAGYSIREIVLAGVGLAFIFIVIGFIMGYSMKNK